MLIFTIPSKITVNNLVENFNNNPQLKILFVYNLDIHSL